MTKLYSLDNLGFPGYSITEYGQVFSSITGKWLTWSKNHNGYYVVCVNRGCAVTHPFIHRLVAAVFLDNPDNKPQVNHKDGNKANNHYSNLEYCTNLENATHARLNGLMPHAVLDEDSVRRICQDLENGIGCVEISRKYGLPYTSIYKVFQRKNWTHISKDFNIPEPKYTRSVLSDEEVEQICIRLMNNESCASIARDYKRSPSTIEKIRNGKNFKHITSKYFQVE